MLLPGAERYQRSGGKPAVGVTFAEKRHRIDKDTILDCREMQVRPGRAAGRADIADHVTLLDVGSLVLVPTRLQQSVSEHQLRLPSSVQLVSWQEGLGVVERTTSLTLSARCLDEMANEIPNSIPKRCGYELEIPYVPVAQPDRAAVS